MRSIVGEGETSPPLKWGLGDLGNRDLGTSGLEPEIPKQSENFTDNQNNSPGSPFPSPKSQVPSPHPWLNLDSESAFASPEFARPLDAPHNDDIMLIYFTSGTTGMPKMVQHSWTYPLGHIVTAKYWHCDGPGGLHLTVADTGWAKAAWGKIYGQWLCECAVFVYDYGKFVPKNMLEVISKYKITVFCAPPTVYRFFVKEDLSKYDFSALERCCTAGEPLNPEVFEQFKLATGLELVEAFGQTELTVVTCNFPWFKRLPGSVGKAAPFYELDILHDDGSPCAQGEKGQLVVRTKNKTPIGIFSGYYHEEGRTGRVWKDGVYWTGDVAWKDEEGYYRFVGRSDDVIKSAGYRIGPFEVESALLEHPAVLECAVTGVPDPDRGAIVKATIVLAKGFNALESLKKDIQEYVKKVTAPYKYPRLIEFVKELPKTISGKIRRVEIRQNDLQRDPARAEAKHPNDDSSACLYGIGAAKEAAAMDPLAKKAG